jgi:hypothetical protein
MATAKFRSLFSTQAELQDLIVDVIFEVCPFPLLIYFMFMLHISS